MAYNPANTFSHATRAVFASRPAAGTLGNVFLPTDGYTEDFDLGSAWVSYGPVYPFTQPVNANFSWINQGGASVTADKNGILLLDPAQSGTTDARFRVKAAPSTPYTVTAYFQSNLVLAKTNLMMGLCFMDAGTKVVTFHWNNGFIWTTKWSGPSAIVADYSNFSCPSCPGWMQIKDDGTNVTFWLSGDGQRFHQVETRLRGDYLATGPTRVGFFVMASNAATPNLEASATILSYLEA